MRWAIRLEYDGADFAGWQLQPEQRTVQGVVEASLDTLVNHPVRIRAAGRTDTGVHAEDQVAVFDTSATRTARNILAGLNARLPEDVACKDAREVATDWDPRHASHTKTYVYRWLSGPSRSPLRRGRVWHLRGPLDEVAMASAIEAIVGQHDFSSFRAAGCSSTHPVRTCEGARVIRAGDEVQLEVRGTGFLRHMIRIVAGTVTEVGQGRQSADWLAEVLAMRDRSAAGRTAPARGLTLRRVDYARPEAGTV